MDKKKILLISHNFSPEPIGIGKYNGEMLSWLVNRGYDCTVITTFPYYPFWKVQEPYTNHWYKKEVIYNEKSGATLTIYRCPSYIPSDPTGKQRALQDFSFWVTKFFMVFKLILFKQKFDLIITIAPPFHLAYLGLMLKRFNGGKLLYHIQDMQIEAARDLKLFSKKMVLAGLFKVEHKILKRADFVSSISDGMIKKIKAKFSRDIVFFPNWVDTDYFFPLPNRDKLKIKWGYKPDDIVYLYSGAVGVKQRLERILVTAEELLHMEHIKFIICSSGPYKDQLHEQAMRKGLTNISFLQVQEKDVFNEFLNMADIHLVLQIADAGDLVMPSKLTTILAVGGASIITASPGTSLYDMVHDYDFGYVVEPQDRDNQDLLTNQILQIKLDGELEEKRENARKYAVQYLNVDKVMNKFVEDFLG
ncbi:WcaI family glycosyltransferase [Mucilaginibacter psychrotolerans]|uniref:Colanic acid biosynthesis glycosyltransferase WcaI n=1 Tax=Mucilaginibacter psychrotolerans TaxID=1524096 RepID=A0A4Y8SIR1_9SPHI|nr:WcaI family glycosyltransferase [Mucilaginibacter psychrotolerans]TFF38808.1 colanic acid biosynthesis glycosyltransferase WcaI [Mucilaginibacter psychrotolerans]